MIVALDTQNGSIEFVGRISSDLNALRKLQSRFPDSHLWACYEAGVTGFGLYRRLTELGVDCHVIAPTNVPKSALNRQIKNDRRDALLLAQIYINRPRSFVRVPTEPERS